MLPKDKSNKSGRTEGYRLNQARQIIERALESINYVHDEGLEPEPARTQQEAELNADVMARIYTNFSNEAKKRLLSTEMVRNRQIDIMEAYEESVHSVFNDLSTQKVPLSIVQDTILGVDQKNHALSKSTHKESKAETIWSRIHGGISSANSPDVYTDDFEKQLEKGISGEQPVDSSNHRLALAVEVLRMASNDQSIDQEIVDNLKKQSSIITSIDSDTFDDESVLENGKITSTYIDALMAGHLMSANMKDYYKDRRQNPNGAVRPELSNIDVMARGVHSLCMHLNPDFDKTFVQGFLNPDKSIYKKGLTEEDYKKQENKRISVDELDTDDLAF